MKKMSALDKIKKERLRKKRERKANKRKASNKNSREEYKGFGDVIIIKMPSEVSIFDPEPYHRLMGKIKVIRRHILYENQDVILDFSNIEHFYVSALIKLHSEMEVLREYTRQDSSVRCKYPFDQKMRKVMKDIGFMDSRNIEQPPSGIIPIRSDTRGDRFQRELFENMNRAFYDGRLQKDGDEWAWLQGAIGEAILNVSDHAYESEDRREVHSLIGDRWWLAAQTIGDQLFIVFMDKGIGIPKTLLSSKKDRKITRVLARYLQLLTKQGNGQDSSAILSAVRYGNSRLKQRSGGRGTGLNEVMRLIENNPDGELHIFSNNGMLLFRDGEEVARDHKRSIHGTLIQWNICLSVEHG